MTNYCSVTNYVLSPNMQREKETVKSALHVMKSETSGTAIELLALVYLSGEGNCNKYRCILVPNILSPFAEHLINQADKNNFSINEPN